MLSITQKPGGSIHIGIMPGVEIQVIVAAIRGNTVQFAIECPREFPILRHELYVDQGGFSADAFKHAADAT